MRKIVFAEWDPETKTLKLLHPLDGITSGDEVHVVLASEVTASLDDTRGLLKGEAGDELASIVEEMFPTDNERPYCARLERGHRPPARY